MHDPSSPEATEARKDQEDPIVMYLIVRETLGMSIGKTAAQCAHASQMLMLKYLEQVSSHVGFFGLVKKWFNSIIDRNVDEPALILFKEWLDGSFRKVTLKADDKEWHKIKLAFLEGVTRVTVVDAGLTEIAAGSETVIGLWPMRKSQVPKIIKRLQVLK